MKATDSNDDYDKELEMYDRILEIIKQLIKCTYTKKIKKQSEP